MGRGAETQRLDEEAELLVYLLVGQPDGAQNAALQLGLVDANRAAAHLEAVHDNVVAVGAASQGVGLNFIQVLVAHAGEGVVLGGVALLVLVVLEHGEVHDPAQVVPRAIQVEQLGAVQAHLTQHLVDHGRLVRAEHDQVSRLDVERALDGGQLVFGEELGDGAVDLALAAVLNPGHALGAPLDGQLAQLVDLRARPVAHALGVDGLHHPARCQRPGKDLESAVGHNLGDVHELHAEAPVGTVAAVFGHGLRVGHAVEREGDVVDADGRKDLLEHVFHQAHDVVIGHEAHLDVDLGELGLAVGAQIFVAEAPRNLVVALHAAHLRELLEQLRRLGQGVELARVHARGHDEVARAFRRRLAQDRGLDFGEGTLVQRVAYGPGDGVAQAHGISDGLAAQIEVAPLHARRLVGVRIVVKREGRRGGLVQNGTLLDHDVDLAGGQFRVCRVLGALAYKSRDLDAPLGTHLLAQGKAGGGMVGVEDHLGDALAVAQVHEDEAAVVAALAHPARQGNGLADVAFAQLAAGVRVHGVLV